MTIRLGATTFNQENDTLVIKPPTGFNGANALRITNYTVDVIILQNITGTNPGDRQYIMPFQQTVFEIETVQDYPTMKGQQLGVDIPQEQVLVEWADNGLDDFEGTYPTQVTVSPFFPTDGLGTYLFSMDEGSFGDSGGETPAVVLGGNAHIRYPQSTSRLGATIVNWGPDTIFFTNTVAALGTVAVVPIGPGASMTIGNGGEVVVGFDDSVSQFSVFGDQVQAS